MKIVKILLIVAIFLGAIGYGIYYFGTNIVADKVVDYVGSELENSGELQEVKKYLKDDPELQKFVEEGANVDESTLPFTTKEEATRVLVKKFGLNGANEIRATVQDGVTNEEKQQLIEKVESKLSEKEMLALKMIVYKELNK